MNSEYTITERGQITLPKDLRDRLGLRPGMEIRFLLSKDGILIQKAINPDKDPFREVFGVIKDGQRTDGYLAKIRGKVE